MALIVEDGSGVANADSFVDLNTFVTWAEARGKTIPDDETTEALLRRAVDYIASKEACFQGYRTDAAQALPFPRAETYINGFLIETDAIPQAVITAQMELALASYEGVSLFPSGNDQFVVFEKVGPIATSYSEKFGNNTPVHVPAAEYLLEQLCGNSFGLSTVRV